MAKDTLEMLVDAGKAGPNPTAAQKLSAYKLNIGEVFQKVNDKTSDYKGMQVPIKIIIDKDTKEVEIEVGLPPVSSMIKKEIGIDKARISEEEKTAGKTVTGSITMEQCVKVAKMKMTQMLVKNLKAATKQVVGTAVSMEGIQVEGKDPKEVLSEIDNGTWDKLFSQ